VRYLKSVVILALVMTSAWLADTHNWAQMTPCPPPQKPTKPLMLDADLIRVGISDNGMTQMEYPGVTLTGVGPYRVRQGDKVVLESPAFAAIHITKSASGFLIHTLTGGTLGPFCYTLTVEPVDPDGRLKITSITRKGIVPSYRGIIELVAGASSPDKFSAVNVLPMQDYLKAVVPNELPIQYGYEAVKAQAVAARNYAIRPREKPWPQFDICDSPYCQAYYGAQTEDPQVTKALAETQGLVALYQGQPILALYSSSIGGYRESYENSFSDPLTNKFPGTPIPYLQGGPDMGEPVTLNNDTAARAFYTTRYPNSFDVQSPMYRWQTLWPSTGLEAIINKNLAETSEDGSTRAFVQPAFHSGETIGVLQDITVLDRGVSGKAMHVRITGSHGTWVLSKEFVIRKVLRYNGRFLPSANVVLDMIRDRNGHLLSVKASGGGMGHGVGMSQLGASYMSKHGSEFTDILKHYYTGIAIGTIPLTATATQGMKTTFYVDKPQGTLFVQGTSPVQVQINDKTLTITQHSLPISQYLKTDMLNQLEIKPLQSPSIASVWIEL